MLFFVHMAITPCSVVCTRAVAFAAVNVTLWYGIIVIVTSMARLVRAVWQTLLPTERVVLPVLPVHSPAALSAPMVGTRVSAGFVSAGLRPVDVVAAEVEARRLWLRRLRPRLVRSPGF